VQIGLLAVPTTGPLSMYLQGQSYYVSTPDQSLMQEDQPQLKSKALRDSDNKTPQPPSSRGCNQHSPTPWSLNQRSPSCSMDDFRKYGRYDFERFDHISSSHANIGHGTFDKVNVNCSFLFKKSKWGVLGEHRNPAGIIYLDLTFIQPKGSQLHSATVSVTLDDEDEDLDKMRSKLARRESTGPQCPIQITDCYGRCSQSTIFPIQMCRELSLLPRHVFRVNYSRNNVANPKFLPHWAMLTRRLPTRA
jgi:hypothetical protein